MTSLTLLVLSLAAQDPTAAYDRFSECIRGELERATQVASSREAFARYLDTRCKAEEATARKAMVASMNGNPDAEAFHQMAVDTERAVTVDMYPGD
ncbi:hypothetical protein [Sphingomicrobium nitratireducens]|uniref:hypothetical protein n=1 Tax=Sphingomicrobium nitratireducens TaxID=2964666 RepID=UPI00224078F9|nr:hypothetical protein [Sphingomicrobium nitratireducens]